MTPFLNSGSAIDRWGRGAVGLLPIVVFVVLPLVLFGCDSQEPSTPPEEEPEPVEGPEMLELSGDLRHVHDPAIIKAQGEYYLYSTGGGIQWRRSPDLTQWTYEGDVLGGVPQWAEEEIEGIEDLWAPDVAYFNGRYHLYYSASTFGSQRSVIGVATSPALNPDSAAGGWNDRGKVLESFDDVSYTYNAIDPNIAFDEQDRVWMAFGSWFETGIRMRRIDPETGMPSNEDDSLYALANRPDADENAIEAPYIIRHEDYYYLFVSFDHCCQGVNSDYNVRVGRAESITGPYVDADGVPMTEGGGTLVIEGTPDWKGTGHNSVLQDGEDTYLVYHAYSVQHDGDPFLRISPLEWEDGWPVVPTTQLR